MEVCLAVRENRGYKRNGEILVSGNIGVESTMRMVLRRKTPQEFSYYAVDLGF